MQQFIETREAFTQEKSSSPTGLIWNTNMTAIPLFWDTNMAAVSLFRNTNMAEVTSSENALYTLYCKVFRQREKFTLRRISNQCLWENWPTCKRPDSLCFMMKFFYVHMDLPASICEDCRKVSFHCSHCSWSMIWDCEKDGIGVVSNCTMGMFWGPLISLQLQSFARCWVEIRTPKQSHRAIWFNTYPVSGSNLKWPIVNFSAPILIAHV